MGNGKWGEGRHLLRRFCATLRQPDALEQSCGTSSTKLLAKAQPMSRTYDAAKVPMRAHSG